MGMMKQAVILAAGEGQRLRPFTVTRPKGMLSIAGKPILQHVVEALAQQGIRKIVLVAGYRREQIFDHFGNGKDLSVDIEYVTQERQLGTAHALAQAKDAVRGEFLVLGGDNLIDAETVSNFIDVRPPAMLLKHVPDASRYGVVGFEDGRVTRITEKPTQAAGDAVNVGIYAFGEEIFDHIGSELDLPDVINGMLSKGEVVHPYVTRGTWLDVVYPWDIVRLNGAILDRISAKVGGTIESGVYLKGQVSVGRDTVIKSNSYIVGPAVIGEHCEIGPNVCILPSTSIGDNVSVAPFTTIDNSVIGHDVTVGPSSIIEDSVIDGGCIIRGRITASTGEADVKIEEQHHSVNIGTMLGTGCYIGSGVVAEAGSIVGNYSRVGSLRILRGSFPDRSLIV
jgi:UDP-N-acetylglucosamine diphosphorylase/glucosamine-1-phosphate N-acetyltransferase